MEHRGDRIPIAQLAAAIEDMLQDGPHVVDEIVHALHYSGAAVRTRLHQLMKEGRVHRRRIACDDNPALLYRWHAGPPEREEFDADLAPVQVTVQRYPAVGRRDPLVAALFGLHRQPVAGMQALN